MFTEVESRILEQLAAINKRLDKMEERLDRILPEYRPYTPERISSEQMTKLRALVAEKERLRAEDNCIDAEIRSYSEKMPPELRPVPDQYKSSSRKKEVLSMVKDTTRWFEIPMLSKQWYKPKRAKPARPIQEHPRLSELSLRTTAKRNLHCERYQSLQRRKPTAKAQFVKVKGLINQGKTKQAVADELKIGVASVYRIMKGQRSQ